jgi:hypothetical protein
MKKLFLIFMCLFLWAGPVLSEEIVLKSGVTIQGQILERSDQWIKMQASGLDVLYYLDEIVSIDGNPVGISDSPARLAVPPSASVQSAEPPPAAVSSVTIEEAVKGTIAGPPKGSQSSVTMTTGRGVKSASKLTPKDVVVIFLVMLFLVSIAVILFCYPVFVIAKKTGAQYPFFAFIPILNLYLLCKIADRPVWWLILYLLPFVSLVIDVLVWINIAKLRHKPEWLGILSIVPFLNLVMFWYVALSDRQESS